MSTLPHALYKVSPTNIPKLTSACICTTRGLSVLPRAEEMTREDVEACTAVISNFPAALPPGQRDSMLQPFVALGGLVV